MRFYTEAFEQEGIVAAQVLLNQDDMGMRDRALALRTTFLRLLEFGVVPIVNENDSVGVRELLAFHNTEARERGEPEGSLVFGDNDGLSALLAGAMDADLLVMLTNVDALYTANPKKDPCAKRLSEVPVIDDQVRAVAGGATHGGLGGMASKVDAAAAATGEGAAVVVASGEAPGTLTDVLAGKPVGTFFPSPVPRGARLRRIATAAAKTGALVVNAGAIKALTEGKGSLSAHRGDFGRGNVRNR